MLLGHRTPPPREISWRWREGKMEDKQHRGPGLATHPVRRGEKEYTRQTLETQRKERDRSLIRCKWRVRNRQRNGERNGERGIESR